MCALENGLSSSKALPSRHSLDSTRLTHLPHTHPARLVRIRKTWQRSTSWRRSASSNNDDNDKDNGSSDKEGLDVSKYVEPIRVKLDIVRSAVRSKLPPQLVTIVESAYEKAVQLLPTIRTVLLSFTTGALVMFGCLTIPVYQEVQTLAEPVTLFETILGDLNRGYVDPVDTQKLFETGVNAMLRSLDPYTEFEGKQEAVALTESIGGKYGGVGLVISGATPRDLKAIEEATTKTATETPSSSSSSSSSSSASDQDGPNVVSSSPGNGSKLIPNDALQDNKKNTDAVGNNEDDDEDDDTREERKFLELVQRKGIQVVSAFEGYAFDYGMRVGDRLVNVDGMDITARTSVEDVRNRLRGDPGTTVDVSFEREGVSGVQTVTIPRTIVRINDVKLATLVGDPQDGIGYIQLSGFASDAGREVRAALLRLQQQSEEASGGSRSLQGLILDLRGNPGGLLTSAVDVASLFVPKGSDIVSARGRGFPGVLYRSRVDPLLSSNTKLAVLVNGGTASAAEIVSGAIQDLDVGVIVGSDRTFGKGLVQSVSDLPFETALKLTVAKYYTPSGRCIQGINYTEGDSSTDNFKYKANRVADRDRSVFYTKSGREVKDGGGIEADVKVEAPQASALEVTLLRSGVVSDFAAQWSRTHELSNRFEVDEETYRSFQTYVHEKQESGELKLDALYNGALGDLQKALKRSGYKGATKELDTLKASILRDVQRDFDKYRADIKEDIAQGILARYLPESMLIERSLQTDQQVQAAVKLMRNDARFDKILARERTNGGADSSSLNTASLSNVGDDGIDKSQGAKVKLDW